MSGERRVGIAAEHSRDLPPPGGFETIKYKRSLPIKGPSGAVIFGTILAISGWGFYKLGQGNLEMR